MYTAKYKAIIYLDSGRGGSDSVLPKSDFFINLEETKPEPDLSPIYLVKFFQPKKQSPKVRSSSLTWAPPKNQAPSICR
jgi:hypothetical protein